MGRGVTRVTQALAVALLAGAASAQAQITISVEDYPAPRILEQSGGFWGPLQIWVRLPGPAGQVVTVDWAIVPGSATQTPGNDYAAAAYNGTFTFSIGEDSKAINIQINGDTIDEWTLPQTYHQDEVFFVRLSNASANATIKKDRTTITLIDDDRPMPGLQFLAAVSAGDAGAGQNKLLWRVPAAPTQPNDIRIRWNTGATCAPPASTTEPLSGTGFG